MIATSFFLTLIICSNNSSITIGETPAVGSSNIKTEGSLIKARPKATCCL